jgi:hypothetical protein
MRLVWGVNFFYYQNRKNIFLNQNLSFGYFDFESSHQLQISTIFGGLDTFTKAKRNVFSNPT